MPDTISRAIADLARPAAWPDDPGPVEVEQTHVSVVFLTRDLALKLKKPVDLGFLDFGSRERRRQACLDECRLNARLAPDVYLGVVAVAPGPDGRLCVHRREPARDEEPAVLMRRLPASCRLSEIVARGEADDALLRRIALRVAAFHDEADAGAEAQAATRWDALAGLVRANLSECDPFVGVTLEHELRERLGTAMQRELAACRGIADARAARGVGRDGHGDLRLDHVYVLPDDRIVIIDCLEFSDELRRGDPVGDVAFLAMELRHEGRGDLATAFASEWARARGDAEAPSLLPLHVAHRHAVRGKVRSIEAGEREVSRPARQAAAARARAHFLAAFASVAEPNERPALVLTCGLPGTGKSTLARGLAERAAMARVSSDETRRALAGWLSEGGDRYSAGWTDRTYGALREQAEALLLQGRRVVADASFHEAGRRADALALAARLRVPALVLECVAPAATCDARIAARRGDASEADAAVRALMEARWAPPGDDELAVWRRVDAGGDAASTLHDALLILEAEGLFDARGSVS